MRTSDANIDDACAIAWAKLVSNQPRRASVFSWLVTVAVHEAYRLDRHDRTTLTDGEELERLPAMKEGDFPEQRILWGETLEALESVHPRKRRMLLLTVLGYTCKELGAEDGVSTARARALIYQARLQLLKRTGRPGVDPRARK